LLLSLTLNTVVLASQLTQMLGLLTT